MNSACLAIRDICGILCNIRSWRVAARVVIAVVLLMSAWGCEPGSAAVLQGTGAEIAREMKDPCLGLRWHLIVDKTHPGWPARLVVADSAGVTSQTRQNQTGQNQAGRNQTIVSANQPGGEVDGSRTVIIHSGERITVDQQSKILHARFQAVALESVAAGEMFRVRLITAKGPMVTGLTSGTPGPVISVLATSAGTGQWLLPEAQPQ
jgi:hypothetical protein